MNPFVGTWRIVEMDQWDRDYLDLVVHAFVDFRPDGLGSFQFGTVSGFLDTRLVKRGEALVVEWSWEGESDTDPACGRGWARIQGDQLIGHIFIHRSDDSGFRAIRGKARASRPSRPSEVGSGGAA
jgi:hypothetical protein